jgi:MFS family permease
VLSIARQARPPRQSGTSIRKDIGQGLCWIREHRLIRDLILLTAVIAITLYMVTAVQVLYVLDNLHVPVSGYGFMIAASGAGSIAGGVVAARVSRRLGRSTTLVGATLVAGMATMATGFTRIPALAAVLFATTALAFVVGDVLSLSLRQAMIPTELFGRVQGGYRTLVWGAFPAGAIAGGALAAVTDVATVYRCAGVVHMLAGVGVWRLVRAHRTEIDAAFTAPSLKP